VEDLPRQPRLLPEKHAASVQNLDATNINDGGLPALCGVLVYGIDRRWRNSTAASWP